MKKIKFLLVATFCIAVSAISCSSDDSDGGNPGGSNDTVSGISLDKDNLTLEEGKEANLKAILVPLGATATIEWKSSDPAVATVDDTGLVTALKEGTASIAAAVGVLSATCNVTVIKEVIIGDAESLKGSDYYVIAMDDTTFETIEDKVIADFRPDNLEFSKNLYIWDETFNPGNSNGNNFYGIDDAWTSLSVGSKLWSGGGYNLGDVYGDIDMTRMFDNPENYYLHVGLKTGQATSSFLLILSDGTTEVKIAIGGEFNDNGSIFEEYAPLKRDNTWDGIEIPVTDLNNLGLTYSEKFSNVNILAFLAGGTAGTTFDMDAVFFYKKGN
jgi:hypothetical protein